MVLLDPQPIDVQEIRLKRDQINHMLLYYLKCKVVNFEDETWQDHELRLLTWYENIVAYLQDHLTQETSLEEDKSLLKSDQLSWFMRMAITYRMERVKILMNQREVIRMCKYVVMLAGEAISEGTYRQCVLRKTDDELEAEGEGTEKAEVLEERYQRRRLINSTYFR